MSKAVKVVGAVVVSAVGYWLAPFTGGQSLVWAGKIATYLFVTGALEYGIDALTDKPKIRRTAQDVEYQGTFEPGRIIYGEQRVSGMNVIPPWTSGNKNKYLHQVLAVAAHRVQTITTVYFGQEAITSMASVTGSINDGVVGSGTYQDKAWIRRYRGTNSQPVDYILTNAFTQWTSEHRGLGIAYLAIQYELDEDVYQNGKPEVTCIVQGKRCYDPRLDTSPGENWNDAAYVAYTTNPALCLADYLTDASIGLGEDSARIDWDLVVEAADICDELVVIPPTSSPVTTQKRYTCNITLDIATNEDMRREHIKTLAGAMMGCAYERAGKWRLHAGAARDSTFTLDVDTEQHEEGEIQIRRDIPLNELYNYVPGNFVDADRNYQLLPFEPRSNAAYETADGDQYPREVSFLACDNQYEAQRNALITLKRSRRAIQITGQFGMSAVPIRPWDVGTVTCTAAGLSGQLMRCMGFSFNQVGTVDLTLLEEGPTDWDDPAIGDYTVPSIGIGPNPGSSDPEEITQFVVIGIIDGVKFNIEHPPGWIPNDTFRVYAATTDTTFSNATLMASSNSDLITVKLDDANPRWWWVTHKRRQVESDPYPSAAGGVRCSALAITDSFHATASVSSLLKTLIGTGTGTTSSVTVTAIKGTPTYTYTWTRDSGSTKISVVAASSATTGFSGTGFVNGETQVATFKCLVKDSSSPQQQFSVYVKVTFRRDDNAFS